MEQRQGILLVISGFSGVGKGTVVKELIKNYPQYALSVSATTRSKREGEEDGVAYFFKTVEEFKQMIEDAAFIEYAQYVDNYYGTPKAYVQEQLKNGKDVILEIEIQGARRVKEQFPEAVLLFISAKDAETLKERLIGRGTESLEVVEKRLAVAAKEAQGMEEYDYFVINDDLQTCVEEIHAIVESEHQKSERNTDKINKIRDDLQRFVKGE